MLLLISCWVMVPFGTFSWRIESAGHGSSAANVEEMRSDRAMSAEDRFMVVE